MTQTSKNSGKAAAIKKAPTHGVSFRKNSRKAQDGTVYREPFVDLGAAWQNEDGSISFPMMGGWVSIRPFHKEPAQEAA